MFESINKALMFLFSHNKINEEQLKILLNYYKDVVSSNSFDTNHIVYELKKLHDDQNYVNAKVNDIMNVNNNSDVNGISNNIQDNEDKNELIDVTDFIKEKQNYIKLTYSDGSIRILENNLDGKGEDLFNVLREKYGQNDITHIFHEFNKDSIEINLYNFKDLSNRNVYNQLSQEDAQLVNIVMSTYPDKKVLCGVSQNMFVVQEVGQDDLLVQVMSLNGVYQVRPIMQSNIEYEQNDGQNSNSISHQKTLSTQVGKMMSERETGFTTFVLITFLGGIGIGIISMIILNFMA